MKVTFVNNPHARDLVTIREDDLIWRGKKTISPIPEGAIVRAFIPSDADPGDVDEALDALEERALVVAKHRMPKAQLQVEEQAPTASPQQVREVILGMTADPDVLPLLEEALARAGL